MLRTLHEEFNVVDERSQRIDLGVVVIDPEGWGLIGIIADAYVQVADAVGQLVPDVFVLADEVAHEHRVTLVSHVRSLTARVVGAWQEHRVDGHRSQHLSTSIPNRVHSFHHLFTF